MNRLVLASGNPGKLRELQHLLAPLAVEIVTQVELDIGAAEEPHPSFVENALAKARHVAARSGMPALADDSGICCAALAGAPGVRSARFAGAEANDAANNLALIAALSASADGAAHAQVDRRAHYTCVLVALRHATDPEPLIAEARWQGQIIDTPRGSGGFGYDPHFLLPELDRTAAQLPAEEKNRISHRGLALRALVELLRGRWGW
jgi:XTP/dITP diphosphohydrolase